MPKLVYTEEVVTKKEQAKPKTGQLSTETDVFEKNVIQSSKHEIVQLENNVQLEVEQTGQNLVPVTSKQSIQQKVSEKKIVDIEDKL